MLNCVARVWRITLLSGLVTVATTLAEAVDRHVYLDTDGDGFLNDCPNPAHNAKGVSGTDRLDHCSGGTQDGRIIGTATGRVTGATCNAGGGTVIGTRNGVTTDVDGDGIKETVYGHPQACVWNMGISDSCEIHAGTYRNAGAMASEATGDASNGAGSATACDNYDCWFASLIAFGLGPNLSDNAYGTASNPAYVRGALMTGSTDTWDANGNRRPDSDEGLSSYPARLSGDRNGNGAFETTTCSGNTCSGDSFFMAIMGCGSRSPSGSHGQILCGPGFVSGERGVFVDTDANGSFDLEISDTSGSGFYGVKNVNHLVLKDIEFFGYNGGNGVNSGVRPLNGHINLNGDGSSVGLKTDHLYIHDNDYSLTTSSKNQWAVFGDYENRDCRPTGFERNYTEHRNSLIFFQTARLWENDNAYSTISGCAMSIHDNRIIIDASNHPERATDMKVFYLKPIDAQGPNGVAKDHRIYNNEFIVKRMSGNTRVFVDLQGFGNGQTRGLGELWVYGNVFRDDPNPGALMENFHEGWCAGTSPEATQKGMYYFFNNTFDSTVRIQKLCQSKGGAGDVIAERNSAYYRAQSLYQDTTAEFATIRRSNNRDATTGCSNLFENCSTTKSYYNALTMYRPKVGGPLDRAGSCDPDGDGIAGVDYDGDGANDTTWRDIEGNLVTCSSVGAPLHIGAIQAVAAGTNNDPPSSVTGTRRTDAR